MIARRGTCSCDIMPALLGTLSCYARGAAVRQASVLPHARAQQAEGARPLRPEIATVARIRRRQGSQALRCTMRSPGGDRTRSFVGSGSVRGGLHGHALLHTPCSYLDARVMPALWSAHANGRRLMRCRRLRRVRPAGGDVVVWCVVARGRGYTRRRTPAVRRTGTACDHPSVCFLYLTVSAGAQAASFTCRAPRTPPRAAHVPFAAGVCARAEQGLLALGAPDLQRTAQNLVQTSASVGVVLSVGAHVSG